MHIYVNFNVWGNFLFILIQVFLASYNVTVVTVVSYGKKTTKRSLPMITHSFNATIRVIKSASGDPSN